MIQNNPLNLKFLNFKILYISSIHIQKMHKKQTKDKFKKGVKVVWDTPLTNSVINECHHECDRWLQSKDAIDKCDPWLQSMDAVNGCNPWMRFMNAIEDAINEFDQWMRSMNEIHECDGSDECVWVNGCDRVDACAMWTDRSSGVGHAGIACGAGLYILKW